MSVAKYPVMKSSNLGWVDQIPSQWDLKPFFSLFKEQKRSNKGMKSDNLLSLSYGIIKRKEISTLDGLLPASFETYQIVEPDELVFRLTDLQNDKRSLRSALATERGIITSAYLAVEPQNINPRYASYLFRSYDLSKVFYSMGGGLRQGLNFADLRRLPILYPSAKEQQKIAQFLDYETAKIDALINEQKRLIELLKEKRQAVISHAVTKGLNPDVPMKDSGVEWLGEVPEHWDVVRLRHLCKITTGGKDTQDATKNGKYPFFVRSDNIERINSYSFDGEGVMTSGDGAGVGKIFHHFIGKFELHQRVYLFHQFSQVTGAFFYNFLKSHLEPVALSQSAKSTVDSLRLPLLQNFEFAVPPKSEQAEICSRILYLEDTFSTLMAQAHQSNQLLKERRSALISAAVTGKIDLRDWQPPAGSDTVDSNASVQTERHYG